MTQPKPTVDLGYPTEARGRIPGFADIEEEAAFWDSHDFTDFRDESTPVAITVGNDLAERLTVRLDQADRRDLAHRPSSPTSAPPPPDTGRG